MPFVLVSVRFYGAKLHFTVYKINFCMKGIELYIHFKHWINFAPTSSSAKSIKAIKSMDRTSHVFQIQSILTDPQV